MLGNQRPGTVYWIDHYIVCTNDVARWETFHTSVLGQRPRPSRLRCSASAFSIPHALLPWRLISKRPCRRPRTRQGAAAVRLFHPCRRHQRPFAPSRSSWRPSQRTHPNSAEGEDGTAIYWQDPDGNQFEFWAPDVPPEGAMVGCGPERVGRISHAVFKSRDLDRTAAFFERYCALDPQKAADIPADTLVCRSLREVGWSTEKFPNWKAAPRVAVCPTRTPLFSFAARISFRITRVFGQSCRSGTTM